MNRKHGSSKPRICCWNTGKVCLNTEMDPHLVGHPCFAGGDVFFLSSDVPRQEDLVMERMLVFSLSF